MTESSKGLRSRLSCHTIKANTVRLQLHALAYNLADLLGYWLR